MGIFYIIVGGTYLFSLLVMRKLKSTYRTWGEVPNRARATGADGALAILRANDLQSVTVFPAPGQLSDHYDPRDKTIRLSEAVYRTPSVASLAIAAHESGHAIQDAVDYKPLEFRSRMAPVAQAGARFGMPALFIGLMFASPLLTQIGVLAYLGGLLFQVVTLPVEFNASRRAMAQLEALDLVRGEEKEGAAAVLRAAAMTYVAGVASSAGYMIYLLLIGGRYLFKKTPAPPAP